MHLIVLHLIFSLQQLLEISRFLLDLFVLHFSSKENDIEKLSFFKKKNTCKAVSENPTAYPTRICSYSVPVPISYRIGTSTKGKIMYPGTSLDA